MGSFQHDLTYFLIPWSGCNYSHTNDYNFAILTLILQDDHLTARAWATYGVPKFLDSVKFVACLK